MPRSANNTIYILREWIKVYKLDFEHLSKNPNAINLLQTKLSANEKINWQTLCLNPNAIRLLEYKILEESKLSNTELNKKNIYDRIDWSYLSSNPNAIHLLEKQIEKEKKLTATQISKIKFSYKIDWNRLSANPNAMYLLKENTGQIVWDNFVTNENLDLELLKIQIEKERNGEESGGNIITHRKLWKNPNTKLITFLLKLYPLSINWQTICENTNSIAIKKIKKQIEKKKINDWSVLSENPKAIEILTANPNIIHWWYLSSNPKAISLLEKRVFDEANSKNKYNTIANKIDWNQLSANPNAIHLLKANPDKIDVSYLCSNPNAINLLRERIDTFTSENWKTFSMNPCIFKKNTI